MNQLSENVKALFFAQYFGVENCAYNDGYERAFTVSTVTLNSEDEFLLLRKVEQLTDGELVTVITIFDKNAATDWSIEQNQRFAIELFEDEDAHVYQSPLNYLVACDFLRSIGILLPFTYLQDGKPKTLTPEQIVEVGWVRIKTD